MADMIGGLFGPTPYQIQQQQFAEDEARAAQMAQMSAVQRGVQGMMQGGAGLARLGAGAMGWQNPSVEAARQQQEAMKGVSFQNPATMRKRADEVRATNPMIAARLEQMADQREMELVDAQRKQAQNIKDYALAEKALRENPNLTTVEVGVEGKPGWVQTVLVDKTDKNDQGIPVGPPKMGSALAKQSFQINAGGGKGYKETDEAGNVTFFDSQGNVLRVVPGAGKPSADFAKNRTDAIQRVASLESDIPTFSGKLDSLISHKGLSGITGLQGGFPSTWGSNAAQAEAALTEVRTWMSGIGLEKLRAGGGIGAVTEKEWKLLEQQVANLDPAKYSTEAFRQKLRDVKKEGERILAKAVTDARIFNERSAPRTPQQGVQQPAASDAGVAIGRTPDGRTVYRLPNGKQVAR